MAWLDALRIVCTRDVYTICKYHLLLFVFICISFICMLFVCHLLSLVSTTSPDALHIIYTSCIHHLCIISILFIVICVIFSCIIYYYLWNVSISFIVICEHDLTGCAAYYIYIMHTPLVHYFYIMYCYLCNICVYHLLPLVHYFYIIYCYLCKFFFVYHLLLFM